MRFFIALFGFDLFGLVLLVGWVFVFAAEHGGVPEFGLAGFVDVAGDEVEADFGFIGAAEVGLLVGLLFGFDVGLGLFSFFPILLIFH